MAILFQGQLSLYPMHFFFVERAQLKKPKTPKVKGPHSIVDQNQYPSSVCGCSLYRWSKIENGL
ncbi:hypothetical protein LINGRAHAP2_LOCUS16251, partial [Linum grandiflorum]